MNLHRSEKKPDWEYIDKSQYNIFQKWADKTKGIITPGNLLSLSGILLVNSGLNDIKNNNRKKGVTKIVAGRLFDVADGWMAEKTGTKSPKGEAVDAIGDKLVMFRAMQTLFSSRDIPIIPAAIIASQNISNSFFTIVAENRRAEIHPSYEGKRANVAQWVAIGGFIMSKEFQQEGNQFMEEFSKRVAYFATGVDINLGTIASIYCMGDALGPPTKK